MAKLINGNGNPAIYAAEDADLIASLAGNVTCIANVGNKYAATEEDATTIRLDDGVIITKEGRRIQLEAGESDTFYIPTGTSGQTNYYIIGYKLVQNADSTQVAEQFVQKMNSSSATITEDTFRGGATEVYVSLYRVTQVGFTIDSINGLLPELLSNSDVKDDIDQINISLPSNNELKLFYNNKEKVDLIANAEGGNIQIYPPDSQISNPATHWEVDAYNGDLRIYFQNSDVEPSTISALIVFPKNMGLYNFKTLVDTLSSHTTSITNLQDVSVKRVFRQIVHTNTNASLEPNSGYLLYSWEDANGPVRSLNLIAIYTGTSSMKLTTILSEAQIWASMPTAGATTLGLYPMTDFYNYTAIIKIF